MRLARTIVVVEAALGMSDLEEAIVAIGEIADLIVPNEVNVAFVEPASCNSLPLAHDVVRFRTLTALVVEVREDAQDVAVQQLLLLNERHRMYNRHGAHPTTIQSVQTLCGQSEAETALLHASAQGDLTMMMLRLTGVFMEVKTLGLSTGSILVDSSQNMLVLPISDIPFSRFSFS